MAHQWSWKLLRAGSFRLDGGGMFGVVPKTIWSKLAPPDNQNRIPLQTNCLLLDDGSSRVLIETGFGDKWSDKERGFYELQRRTVVDALREVDVAADEIDHVIVTHLHFDHAAGLTSLNANGEVVPTFANAEVIVQKTEWEDALVNKSTMSRTYLHSHLHPIAHKLRLIDGGGAAQVLPAVHVQLVPGHTWGQQAVRFADDSGEVVFAGDVVPTINHAGLAFSIGYDMLPYQNMLTKRELFEQAIANDWRLALDHEPGQPIVRVRRDPKGGRDDRFTLEGVPGTHWNGTTNEHR